MGDHLRPAGDLAGLFSSLAPEIAVRARLGQAVGPRRLALPWVTCAPARRQRVRFPSQNREAVTCKKCPSLLSLYAIWSRLKRYGYVNFSVAQPASVAGGIFGNLRLQQHGLCNGLTSPPLDRVMG